jgi:hypothetical protein
VKSRQFDLEITWRDASASLHGETEALTVMTDPQDAGVGGRAACDSDRGIQEDQRNPIPERRRRKRQWRWPFVLAQHLDTTLH